MRMWLGAAVFGLAIAIAAPAPADPAPPPVPPPTAAEQTKTNPVGTLTDLLLGAAAAESAYPAVLQIVPAADPLSSVGLLMPANFGMPAGDQTSPYVLGENAPSGFARLDAFQGVHALLQGSLGRIPGTELGQPLPGTAPPPGTAIPPGLVQYFDPAAGAAPTPTATDPAGPAAPPPVDLLVPGSAPN